VHSAEGSRNPQHFRRVCTKIFSAGLARRVSFRAGGSGAAGAFYADANGVGQSDGFARSGRREGAGWGELGMHEGLCTFNAKRGTRNAKQRGKGLCHSERAKRGGIPLLRRDALERGDLSVATLHRDDRFKRGTRSSRHFAFRISHFALPSTLP
jgi:hypothetical protein